MHRLCSLPLLNILHALEITTFGFAQQSRKTICLVNSELRCNKEKDPFHDSEINFTKRWNDNFPVEKRKDFEFYNFKLF